MTSSPRATVADVYELVYWLKELVGSIERIDGYLFLDRYDDGIEGLRSKIANYPSPREAQSWINIVPIEDFISRLIGEDWDLDDRYLPDLLTIFERAWTFQIQAKFPNVAFSIDRIIIPESGYVWLRITQTDPDGGREDSAVQPSRDNGSQ